MGGRVSSPWIVGGVPVGMGFGPPLAFGARAWFVDARATTIGGYAGGTGGSEDPLKDIEDAYDRLRSGSGDTIYLLGYVPSDGSTGQSARLTETLTWAKHGCNLVGLCPPVHYGQRARITGPSSGGTFSPVINVTGSGNGFYNFSVFDDYTVDPVAVKVTGQRNYFWNVNMQGMGAATGADDAAGASLWIAGGAENLFERCVIGLDTVPRSTTNGEILLTSAAKRNKWLGCHIKSYSDNAGHLFVKAANSGDLDRENTFDSCLFENCPTGIASGTTMTQAMNVHASAGGMILVYNSQMYGATDWAAADNGNVIVHQLYNGTNMTTQGGIMIAAVR